jgi:TRAP-type mannitol/chloroaromatic compound transport system substrate-binding protein
VARTTRGGAGAATAWAGQSAADLLRAGTAFVASSCRPREVLQAAWRAANAFYDETAARNPRFRKVWDGHRIWRNDRFR